MRKLILGLTAMFLVSCAQNSKDSESERFMQDVRTVIRAQFKSYRSCYDSALKRNIKISGKIEIEWVIIEKGNIKDPKVLESSTLKDKELGNCIIKILEKTTFPEPSDDQYAKVSYPFVFEFAD